MSFAPYAEYRDSGVAWLGNVPVHWTAGPIRFFARLESGHTPSRQHPEYWENCTIPWFSLADVAQLRSGRVKYVHDTKETISELGLANSSARLLPAGTVMLSRTASVGFSAIMGRDMATTQDFANWVCGPKLKPEFLLACLHAMSSEFRRLMMGSTHQTIYMPDIAKLAVSVPPPRRTRRHHPLPRPRNREDRRPRRRAAAADRVAHGKAAGRHFPRGHQGSRPVRADERQRRRVAGRGAGALGTAY